jgi:thioredoxin reductase/Pyruvate/2-oxoacid:ferredoxin oxidoreductase delta subunit
MQNLVSIAIALIVLLFFTRKHILHLRWREEKAHESAEKGKLISSGPQAQHPHIDNIHCIGCATCTTVCPEGDVLAMIGGKAVLINGYKCIGHGLCADACPVGAITMVMAPPSLSGNLPALSPNYETTIENMFIAGELGGLALIKNAINQGRECIDTIAERFKTATPIPDVYDVVIVGAGPAGISASLRAMEKKINYLTLDAGELGGTVAKYPRQKLVMTSPVDLPMHGKFRKTELSKEALVDFWYKLLDKSDFNFRKGEKVEDVKKNGEGIFTLTTPQNQYRSRAVIVAIGKSGNPRKLGVPGEDLPKVMYRLIEADHYVNKRILVVGGGDSAVEAAMGLAHQIGNEVTISYRQGSFSRIKERNAQRVAESQRKGKLKIVFNSMPKEFKPESVLLDVNGTVEELPNDFVWIFAGGEPPTAFLKKIGVALGERDMTAEGSREAHQAAREKQATSVAQPVPA